MKIDLNKISTENRNPNSLNIDELNSLEIVTKINQEDHKIAVAIEQELVNIAQSVDVIYKALANNGRLIYIGAGTSGRLGILDASECPPTYGVNTSLVQGIIAGGKKAILESVENAEDDKELAITDLQKIKLNSQDVLVGIAASGRTPYVVSALKYANSINCQTVAIACSKNSAIGNIANIKIEVEVGAEVVTGSTRMKAGTAQKMILNMLTTGAMVKLGKVYSNLMVDVQPLNAKLIERCKSIFIEATGGSYKEAEQYLTDTKFNLKVAILMKITGVSEAEALEVLSKTKSHLKQAIKLLS